MGDGPRPPWGRVVYHLLCSRHRRRRGLVRAMIELRDPFAVAYARSPIVTRCARARAGPSWRGSMNLSDTPTPA